MKNNKNIIGMPCIRGKDGNITVSVERGQTKAAE